MNLRPLGYEHSVTSDGLARQFLARADTGHAYPELAFAA